jgi:hypothetical protein
MELVYPNDFADGEPVDATRLDANFDALAWVLNGNVSKENFRAGAGVRNALKVAPRAFAPLAFVDRVYCAAGATRDYDGALALPHFNQAHGAAAGDGGIDSNALAQPVGLVSMHGRITYQWGVVAGDTVNLVLSYRKALGSTLLTQSLSITTVQAGFYSYAFAYPAPLIDSLSLSIRVSAVSGGSTREWRLAAYVWIVAPHLP